MWDLSQRSNKGIIKYSVGGFICHICIYNCPCILPVKVILSFKKSKGKKWQLKTPSLWQMNWLWSSSQIQLQPGYHL